MYVIDKINILRLFYNRHPVTLVVLVMRPSVPSASFGVRIALLPHRLSVNWQTMK